MQLTLRPYQLQAHEKIIELFKQNKKILMVMPTGTGKSKTAISFIAKYQKHFIFILVVKNRKLVDQLAKDSGALNLDYGVFMADHDEYDDKKSVQVCSIDTMNARGFPHISAKKDIVLMIDEADQSKSAVYQGMIRRYMNRKGDHPEAGRTFLFGMTATPYNGLDHFDEYFCPITAPDALKGGFLVDYVYYIPKQSLDYTGIKSAKGEWSTIQVTQKMNSPKMIADNFNAWLQFGEHRQTLIFCSDKKHAESVMNYINQYYNEVKAVFIHDKTKDADREKAIKDFSEGRLLFLINIRIITRGVDIPAIGCILDLAATLNLNLHIQKLGRGSRPNSFYKNCIVIDPVKNVLNNGHFYMHRPIDLKNEYVRKKSDIESVAMRQCANCFRAAETSDFGPDNICPFCGHQNKKEPVKKISKYAEQKLFLEKATPEQIEQVKMINEFKKILWKYQNIGKKYCYDIAKLKAQGDLVEKYGLDKVLKIKKSIGLKGY